MPGGSRKLSKVKSLTVSAVVQGGFAKTYEKQWLAAMTLVFGSEPMEF